MLCYPARLSDDDVIVVHIRGAEVDDYVHDEEHVHHEVGHVQRVTRVAASSLPRVAMFVQQEGGWVRGDNGRVEDQQQNDPVPKGLDGAVMEQDPPCCFRNLEFVFWQNVRLQRKHLQSDNGTLFHDWIIWTLQMENTGVNLCQKTQKLVNFLEKTNVEISDL